MPKVITTWDENKTNVSIENVYLKNVNIEK